MIWARTMNWQTDTQTQIIFDWADTKITMAITPELDTLVCKVIILLTILNTLQINNLNSLGCLTPLSLTNSPVSGIRAPVTIISNMASSGSPVRTVTINPRGLAIKPSPRPEKLSFITIKNPMEKNKIFISWTLVTWRVSEHGWTHERTLPWNMN